MRINESIQNEFKSRPEFLKLIEKAKSGTGRIHLMGLLSDGGVHSHIDHLLYIHQALEKKKVKLMDISLWMAVTPQKTAAANTLDKSRSWNQSWLHSRKVCGMDRDRRWEKIEACYETSLAKFLFVKWLPLDYLRSEYENDRFDEFITPALFSQESVIKEGNCIFFLTLTR